MKDDEKAMLYYKAAMRKATGDEGWNLQNPTYAINQIDDAAVLDTLLAALKKYRTEVTLEDLPLGQKQKKAQRKI